MIEVPLPNRHAAPEGHVADRGGVAVPAGGGRARDEESRDGEEGAGEGTNDPQEHGGAKRLFRETARVFRIPSRVHAVEALAPEVFTVQLYAGTARGALATRKRVADLEVGVLGFFEEGGFLASNPSAHVIRDGRGIHRAVVGVFLTRAAALAARAALAAKGLAGFVRVLPPGAAIDERSFSNVG